MWVPFSVETYFTSRGLYVVSTNWSHLSTSFILCCFFAWIAQIVYTTQVVSMSTVLLYLACGCNQRARQLQHSAERGTKRWSFTCADTCSIILVQIFWFLFLLRFCFLFFCFFCNATIFENCWVFFLGQLFSFLYHYIFSLFSNFLLLKRNCSKEINKDCLVTLNCSCLNCDVFTTLLLLLSGIHKRSSKLYFIF